MGLARASRSLRSFPSALTVLAALVVLGTAGAARAAVQGTQAHPVAFSPNGDGIYDTTLLRWELTAAAVQIQIEIRPATASTATPPLRLVDLGARPAGVDSLVWDGRDDGGTVLPDDLYQLRVVETDGVGGDLSTGVAAVRLDNTPPPLPQFDPGFSGLDTTVAAIRLSGTAGQADSVIVYEDGAPLDTVVVAVADSSFTLAVALSEGTHTFAAVAKDRAGNQSGLSPAIDVTYRNTAEVRELRALPAYFSPNGDGADDSLHVTFRTDAPTTRLEVQLRKALPPTGTTVADTLPFVRLYDGPAAAGSFAFTWDGRDSTGAPAPESNYFVFVSAESAGVDGSPHPGTPRTVFCAVDLTPPPAPTLEVSLPARTTRSTVTLRGRAAGADSVVVFLNGQPVDEGPAVFTLVVALVLGSNDLTLQAKDLAGNRSMLAGPFTIEYDEPLGFHAPERFRANDAFDVNLPSSARAARIDLFTLAGRHVRTLSASISTPRYELEWDLRDDQGRAVGDGPYIAHLAVTYLDGHVERAKAAVVVAR